MFECQFLIVSLWRLSISKARLNLTPGTVIGTVYNGDYQTLLHDTCTCTKCRSSGSSGFREEDCFSFSHCKPLEAICCMETTILIHVQSAPKPNAVNDGSH